MPVVQALLCCCGDVNPCDCGLTSVSVNWSGLITAAYQCCPVFGGLTPEGSVTINGAAIPSIQASTFNCPYSGQYTLFEPMTACSGGSPPVFDFGLRVTASVVWSPASHPGLWTVSLGWSALLRDISSGSISGGAICVVGGSALYVANSGSAVCPTGTSYSHVSGPTCSLLASPSGVPGCLGSGPGIMDFDVGGVSVT